VRAKPFTAYIDSAPHWWRSSLENYARRPATAFLTEAVHLSDAVRHCRRHFQTKSGDEYTKDSQDSLYRLSAAALAAVMGHLETYQRFLFAGLVEASRFDPSFDLEGFCKQLEKDSSLEIRLGALVAYRGQPAPIGLLIADNLGGWHDPARTSRHFAAIVPGTNMYSGTETEDLRLLWQLRHAVVHTGGWLTLPDSQRTKGLGSLGGKPILLNEAFIETVVRRLHPIVKRATERLAGKVRSTLSASLSKEHRKEVDELLSISSPRSSWL
jgi:hypothetical protein